MLMWQSDNCTGHRRNVPQSNITWPNKRNVVIVTVFGNLYEENNKRESVLPHVLPTLRHISGQKTASDNSNKTLTHQVFVMKINHCDRQPSRLRIQWTFPQKTASVWKWVSVDRNTSWCSQLPVWIACCEATWATWANWLTAAIVSKHLVLTLVKCTFLFWVGIQQVANCYISHS